MRRQGVDPSQQMGTLNAVADDLSGAVEAAAYLDTTGARIWLNPTSSPDDARNAQTSVIVDLNIRHATAREAHRATRRATARQRIDFVKIDSLLRGQPGAIIDACERSVVAPALPIAGRTTVRGRLRGADGFAGAELAATVASPTRLIGIESVRGAPEQLTAQLAAALDTATVPICDAETDRDLDRIVAATRQLPGVGFIGSGGLAAALGRHYDRTSTAPAATYAPVLLVIGSTDPSAYRQIQWLIENRGARCVTAPPGRADGVPRPTPDVPVVLTTDSTPSDPDTVAASLGHAVCETVERIPDVALFLTGGHTARSVLETLDVATLELVAPLEPGTVHCRSDSGRDVVIRPGSMGDIDALGMIIDHFNGRVCDNKATEHMKGMM